MNPIRMTDKIVFFGASVTQQKQGYAWHLSQRLGVEYKCFGHGGCYLMDDGICCIDDALKETPTLCFIDYFSTVYTSTDKHTIDYLDTILYKCTEARCKTIWLFFPSEDHASRLPFYAFLKAHLDSRRATYIDLNEVLTYSTDLCRDRVHTTERGSIEYAKTLYTLFSDIRNTIPYAIEVQKTKYCDIKCLDVNQTVQTSLSFEGDCTIVAVYLTRGPKSGIVYIGDKKYMIWDVHCHYNRTTFHLKNIGVSGTVTIKVSQEPVDYSMCRRPDFDFGFPTKELHVLAVYYIGADLRVV